MKRLSVTLVCFLCFINVSAKEYYSEYSNWGNWTDQKIISSDMVDVETSNKYQYYHEDIVGDYYKIGTNPVGYPNIDNSKYKDIYTDWSTTNNDNLNKEMRTSYHYQNAEDISIIVIGGVSGSYGSLRISEIKLTDNNGNNLNYSIECSSCTDNFSNYVSNGKVNENFSSMLNGSSLRIVLDKAVPYDQINMSLFMYDVTDINKTFNIYFYTYDLTKRAMLEVGECVSFKSNSLDEIKQFDYNYKNMSIVEIRWQDEQVSNTVVTPTPSRIVDMVNEYRYYDRYYYYYNIIKTYSGYIDNPTDYYNKKDDLNTTYYRSRIRDKLQVEDNIIITSKDTKLDSFVKSNVPISIETNMDITKNGTYNVKYITSFITVSKDISVNIPLDNVINTNINMEDTIDEYSKLVNKIVELQNKINENVNVSEYNKLIEEVNDYKIEINSLNMDIEKYKLELDNKEQEKNKMSKEYENKIINLKLDNKENTNTKDNLPLLEIGHNYLLVIPLFAIVVISYALFRKYKNKN